MGQWIKRRADEHQHDMPIMLPADTAVGDIWRCGCGRTFKVVDTKFRASDQREPGSVSYRTAEWEVIPGQRD